MKPPARNRAQAADWWNRSQSATIPTKAKRGRSTKRKDAPTAAAAARPEAPAATEEQAAATMLTLAQAAVANPTNTPAEDNRLQVSFQSTKQLHEFFQAWIERNLCKVLPRGMYQYRAEVRSGLQYPHKRVDNVVYLLDRPQKRYVVIEVDPLEHRANGLVEDVFRINWFYNARFEGGKLYVLRVNPSQYEHADGMVANPPLRERLRRVLQLLRFVYEKAAGEDCSVVRCYYLYYSASRLAQFRGKVACELVEVERDVLHCLTFRPHGDPDYLKSGAA